jgi:hypothetical protein
MAEKSLLGALWGYAIDVSEAFRTVSLRTPVNKDKGARARQKMRQAPYRLMILASCVAAVFSLTL